MNIKRQSEPSWVSVAGYRLNGEASDVSWQDSSKTGVASLRYESSLMGFLKPRPKLTFG
jgi:hypothetical protein